MRTTFLLLLFGALAACASETTTGATTPTAAPCSPDECAKIPEPPIAPTACGPGHENEIGTACGRTATGECKKTLTCAGKRPE